MGGQTQKGQKAARRLADEHGDEIALDVLTRALRKVDIVADINTLTQVVGALAQSTAELADFSQNVASRLTSLEAEARRISESMEALLRRGPSVFVEDHLVVTRVLDRFLMYADTRDLGITPHLVTLGEWERSITQFLLDAIKPGMTVVDAGANIGYFTLLAASAAGEKGVVYAFEPLPRNYEILQKNVTVNWFSHRVQCFPLALLDRSQPIELHTTTALPCSSSIFLRDVAGEPIHLENTVAAEAKPLDEIVDGPVDVIKIDAEGSEPLIFDGMKTVLRRSPGVKIVMEFHRAAIAASGRDPNQFLDQIRSAGFAIRQLTWDGSVLDEAHMDLSALPLNTLILSR